MIGKEFIMHSIVRAGGRGIIYHGTLSVVEPEIAACFASAGGITGGFLNGRTFRESCWYAVPFLVLSVLLMLLTSSCLALRGCAFLPELIIPFAVALVPFTIVYRTVRSRVEHPRSWLAGSGGQTD